MSFNLDEINVLGAHNTVCAIDPDEPVNIPFLDALDVIQWAPGLPKTRSGKIMRRILRKIATDEHDALGDISTLADPGVVPQLIETHNQMRAMS